MCVCVSEPSLCAYAEVVGSRPGFRWAGSPARWLPPHCDPPKLSLTHIE